MVYAIYIAVTAVVIFCAIKCANYVDLIDKKSNLSGAFIGAVLLAAITSLPELFTSISAVSILGNPELVLGNVLGSNVFNLCILAGAILYALKRFVALPVSRSHLKLGLFIVAVYLVMVVTVILGWDVLIPGLNISVTTPAIVLLYVLSVRVSAGRDTVETDGEADKSALTLKQVLVRFVIASLALVGASIYLTFVADELMVTLGIGATLGSALFLGVATSLPELVSSVTLIKMKNFDASVGNIIGSCMFNFMILAVADMLYRGGSIYTASDGDPLVVVGANLLSTALICVALFVRTRQKKRFSSRAASATYIATSLGILGCYVWFLAGM